LPPAAGASTDDHFLFLPVAAPLGACSLAKEILGRGLRSARRTRMVCFMNGTQAKPSGPTLRFRADLFDQVVAPLGAKSMRKKADLIGCSVSTYHGVVTGGRRPSAEFALKVNAALPEFALPPWYFFEVSNQA
jgi:hypothetical protein